MVRAVTTVLAVALGPRNFWAMGFGFDLPLLLFRSAALGFGLLGVAGSLLANLGVDVGHALTLAAATEHSLVESIDLLVE